MNGFPSKYLGTEFDRERYEDIDKAANRDYEILENLRSKLRSGNKHEPSGDRNRFFNVRLPQGLKNLAQKLKSVLKRVIPRKRQQPSNSKAQKEEQASLADPSTKAVTPESIELPSLPETPFSSSKENCTVLKELPNATPKDENVEPLLEKILSGDEPDTVADQVIHRYKHMLPCDEKMPEFKMNLVGGLAKCFEFESEESADWSNQSSIVEGSSKSVKFVEEAGTQMWKRNGSVEKKAVNVSPLSSVLPLEIQSKSSSDGVGTNSALPILTAMGSVGNEDNLLPVKSLLPSQEPRPYVRTGHVERLARMFKESQ